MSTPPYPQQGFPQQPQQPGFPQQPPPPGFGQQPQPPGFGQQPPPPGFGQPPGYPGAPQGQYGQGHPGGPGGPGAPGGYGPPPKKGPNILIIVVVAVVAVALVGTLLFFLFGNKKDPDPVDPTQPTPTVQTPVSPPPTPDSPPPTPDAPPTQPTDPPTDPPTNPPQNPGDAISLGNGISLTPYSGWQVQEKRDTSAVLTNGTAVFIGQVVSAGQGATANAVYTQYTTSLVKGTSQSEIGDPRPVEVHQAVDVVSGTVRATVSGTQGSQNYTIAVAISVRTSDGITVIGTMLVPEGVDTSTLSEPFGQMFLSMVQTQVQ